MQTLQRSVDHIEREYQAQNTQLSAQLDAARQQLAHAEQRAALATQHAQQQTSALAMSVDRLQAQNAILVKEAELLNNEYRRLALENTRFTQEIQRLETMIYGNSKKRAAAVAAATAAAHSQTPGPTSSGSKTARTMGTASQSKVKR